VKQGTKVIKMTKGTDMTISNSKSFWLCQLIGWGGFTLFNLYARGYFVHFSLGELVNSLSGFFAFLISTSLLRKYLKRHLQANSIVRNLLHVLIASIFSAVLTGLLVFVVLIPNHELLFGEPASNLYQQFFGALPNLAIFTMLWASLYVMIRRQKQLSSSEQQTEQLQASLKAAQLDVLISQLNPHFVFNAINNIRALILEDSDKARDCLADLSDVMRTTMQVQQDKLWSFSQEISLVDSYLSLNQLQFEQRLSIKKQIDETVLNQNFPCMMLQLLVENSIKHGIGKSRIGGEIIISAKIVEEDFILCVTNSGQLGEEIGQSGVGLKNIHSRLNLLFGNDATFALVQKEQNVVATITISINHEEECSGA